MPDSSYEAISMEERFLASLVSRDIRVQLDPRSSTWRPSHVTGYRYPEMIISVEDCWHQRGEGHIHLGEHGRMYPDVSARLVVMQPPLKLSMRKPSDQDKP